MDQQNTPAASHHRNSNIPRADGEQQPQQQPLQESGKAREKVRIWNDIRQIWFVRPVSVDGNLPWPRIDLKILRRIFGAQPTFSEGEHSHAGVGGTCIGTIVLRCMSNVCTETFRGIFCVVQGDDRGVVLTASLLPSTNSIGIFPIGSAGIVSSKEEARRKQEAKETSKRRAKEKSLQKDQDQSDKDKVIRGESSTQQQQQQQSTS